MELYCAERDDMLQFLIQANLKFRNTIRREPTFWRARFTIFARPSLPSRDIAACFWRKNLGPLTTEQREVLERMQRSGARLSRTANAMFELSVAHSVDQTLKLVPADIRDCVEQALHEVGPFIDDKQFSVTVDIEPLQPELYCSSRRGLRKR